MTQERSFRKVNPDQVKWEEEGASLEGVLTGATVVTMQTGPVTRYTFQRDDGSYVFCFATSILASLMEAVALGDYVRVTFTGTTDTGQASPAKLFDVEVAE